MIVVTTYDLDGNEIQIGKYDRIDSIVGSKHTNLFLSGIKPEAIYGDGNIEYDDYMGVESEPQHQSIILLSRLDRKAAQDGSGRIYDNQAKALVGESGYTPKSGKYLPAIKLLAQVNISVEDDDDHSYSGDNLQTKAFIVVPNANHLTDQNNHWRINLIRRKVSA